MVKRIVDRRTIKFGGADLIIETPVSFQFEPEDIDFEDFAPDDYERPSDELEADDQRLDMFRRALSHLIVRMANLEGWHSNWLMKLPVKSEWAELLPNTVSAQFRFYRQVETTHGKVGFQRRKEVKTLVLRSISNPIMKGATRAEPSERADQ